MWSGLTGRVVSEHLTRKHLPASARRHRIEADTTVRIERTSTARIELGGTLLLGQQSLRPLADGLTQLRLSEGSLLRTEGWAMLCRGSKTTVGPGATLTLGEGALVSVDARIDCFHEMRIGKDAAISWGATVLDTGHHWYRVGSELRDPTGPVVIGEHAFVGTSAIVLPGVTIGDGAMVAAGSVVTRDVPAGCLVAGTPARVLHEDVEWW